MSPLTVAMVTDLRNARLDALTTFAGNSGKLRVYSGTRPATGGTATTLLAELTMNASLATGASGAVWTANPITADASADATGTASWARLLKSDGTTIVMDMDVGTSGSDINFNTVSFVAGGNVAVTSWTIIEEPGRDPLLWPYPEDSIWNMPLGDSADLVSLGFVYNGNTNTQNSRVTVAEENVLFLHPDAPLAWVMEHNAGWNGALTRCGSRTGFHLDGNGTWTPVQLPVPTGFTTDPYIGTTPNMSGAIVYRDGTDIKLVETQPLHLCSDGVAVSQFVNSSWVGDSIKTGGDGVKGGSHGGSYMTAMGGTIRLGELVPGGVIRHALKVTMDTAYYCSAVGGAGHRWPALQADAGWASVYGTANPSVPAEAKMGMLLTLPNSFDIENDLVSEAAKILARAVHDYGAYLVDGDANAADSHLVQWQVERSNRGSFVVEFLANWGFQFFHRPATDRTAGTNQMQFRTDVGLFMEAICIVDDNSSSNVGGAGTRRALMAPPL